MFLFEYHSVLRFCARFFLVACYLNVKTKLCNQDLFSSFGKCKYKIMAKLPLFTPRNGTAVIILHSVLKKKLAEQCDALITCWVRMHKIKHNWQGNLAVTRTVILSRLEVNTKNCVFSFSQGSTVARLSQTRGPNGRIKELSNTIWWKQTKENFLMNCQRNYFSRGILFTSGKTTRFSGFTCFSLGVVM